MCSSAPPAISQLNYSTPAGESVRQCRFSTRWHTMRCALFKQAATMPPSSPYKSARIFWFILPTHYRLFTPRRRAPDPRLIPPGINFIALNYSSYSTMPPPQSPRKAPSQEASASPSKPTAYRGRGILFLLPDKTKHAPLKLLNVGQAIAIGRGQSNEVQVQGWTTCMFSLCMLFGSWELTGDA